MSLKIHFLVLFSLKIGRRQAVNHQNFIHRHAKVRNPSAPCNLLLHLPQLTIYIIAHKNNFMILHSARANPPYAIECPNHLLNIPQEMTGQVVFSTKYVRFFSHASQMYLLSTTCHLQTIFFSEQIMLWLISLPKASVSITAPYHIYDTHSDQTSFSRYYYSLSRLILPQSLYNLCYYQCQHQIPRFSKVPLDKVYASPLVVRIHYVSSDLSTSPCTSPLIVEFVGTLSS